ncbi:MAG: helix-turn-helix domain-containing protein, partial [Alphaproteobacteria bacterium]|nr:helix-turn-helix domain-containing protein [Alphaproteobacteria bacterium]
MSDPARRRGRPRKALPEAPGTVQALERALDLLDLLAAEPGLTLSEVADKASQPPSTVHRVLHTLALRGMVESDP